MKPIPVSEPLITQRETELVLNCLKTGWISSAGAYIDQFETSWASYCGMPYGVAVSNGTTALQIAVRLLDLQPGDEVIMPTFTIVSCAQAITYCGGIPVLVDSNPENWQMDISQIESKITSRTRAIMVVHIYGHPVDMDPVLEIAGKHGFMVIEDAAEAHGAEYKGKKSGSFGDISTFSFYANKLITTGEGGMVLVKREDLAERARSLRNLCFEKSQRFLHNEVGYNYRLTNIQAALGIAQLERIDQIVDRKRAIAGAYNTQFRDVPTVALPMEERWAKNVYWVYGIVLRENTGMDANEFARRLSLRGIETRPFFLGMHEQPVFKKMGLFLRETYPVAEHLARKGLYIPSGLGITDDEIGQVSSAVRDILLSP